MSLSKLSFRAALSLVFVFFLVAAAYAQYRASIQGVVTDPQGAVVSGATVTLKNLETNQTVIAGGVQLPGQNQRLVPTLPQASLRRVFTKFYRFSASRVLKKCPFYRCSKHSTPNRSYSDFGRIGCRIGFATLVESNE